MFSVFRKTQDPLVLKTFVENISTSKQTNVKVAVLGASGGIGRSLSLLLKQHPLVTELSLYDIVHTIGVAVDLSHIATKSTVTGFVGPEQLEDSMRGAEVVLIPAGVARQTGMSSRDELFNFNALMVYDLMHVVAKVAPKALIAIITNPINSMVPIAAEVLKKAGVFDPKRLFGVSTVDNVRANTFVAEAKGLEPGKVSMMVVGGHSEKSMVPLFSQCHPPLSFTQEELEAITLRIQNAPNEVFVGKNGIGSVTLGMAYSAARFASALCRGLSGEPNIVECSYVQSDVTEAKYFATPLLLGPDGIQKNLGLGKLSEYENRLLQVAIANIKANIKLGEDFMSRNK